MTMYNEEDILGNGYSDEWDTYGDDTLGTDSHEVNADDYEAYESAAPEQESHEVPVDDYNPEYDVVIDDGDNGVVIDNDGNDVVIDNGGNDVVIDDGGNDVVIDDGGNDVVIDDGSHSSDHNNHNEHHHTSFPGDHHGHVEDASIPVDGTPFHENMDHGWYKDGSGNWIPPVFDQDSDCEDVYGTPTDDMDNWHQQSNPDTCAIVSQEFIIEQLTGEEVSEEELTQEAMDNGWYTPGGGTPIDYVGNILAMHGIPIEKDVDATVEDIEAKLENGEKVIVGVDADEIWSPGQSHEQEEKLIDANTVDGDPNHAVEVIGVDRSDPDNPMVILNDPGHPGGCGEMVPMDDFIHAWRDSDCFMVSTDVNG